LLFIDTFFLSFLRETEFSPKKYRQSSRYVL